MILGGSASSLGGGAASGDTQAEPGHQGIPDLALSLVPRHCLGMILGGSASSLGGGAASGDTQAEPGYQESKF